ncbi:MULTISPECIES: hypothetical protein [Bacillus cereus group]|uniref:hypothetical protein n=1 Tax=Bacillus cereus group TaxID=86661 RepID=UPI000330CE3C|nr:MULTISPECIES: hypothetical protein [Bacillus cereus group]EOO04955.1 hypothetical protein IAW_05773 [Bacillus cereus str. Schrouff]EOO81711.1 hypothetical protein IGY_05733 [Bacillus cereus K-5975c]MEC2709708.1 hypothetical protein [Bacillus thuringiensis]
MMMDLLSNQAVLFRIAIGIKEKNYIPVGIYIDGSVKELKMSDLTEKLYIIITNY